MSYDVAIFGDLLFDEKGLRAWKRASVSSASSRAIAQAFPKRKNQPPIKVAALVPREPLRRMPSARRTSAVL